MTRDEALYKVKGYLTDIIPVENYSEVEEIIKALEQEPCEDCISRQDAIEAFYTEDCWNPKPREILESLPSSKPKTGKWERVTEPGFGGIGVIHYTRCSVCKSLPPFHEDITPWQWHSPFCPNCGADMRGKRMSDLISRKDAIALVDRPIVPTGDAVYDNTREDERESIKDDLALLPSAKSTGDLISIQMAIEHWGRSSGNLTNDQIAELQREIESLPSAEPKTGWIPVSERLPEENGAYIVTEKVFSIDDREHKGGYKTKAEQVEYYNGKWRRASFFEVIAWMPLPKPYREDGE